ncbi:MAG: integrase domain-containing protein [Sedimenticola sp.]
MGSRDVDKAAKFALREYGASYSTVATQSNRFGQFSRFIRQRHDIKDLRWVQKHHVIEYIDHLNDLIEQEVRPITAKTAHNRLSAVNRVLEQARGDKDVWVSPSKYLPSKSGITTYNRAPSDDLVMSAGAQLRYMKHGERYSVMADVCDQFGLRFKESVMLDYKKALKEAVENGAITVFRGSKGGKSRVIPLTSPSQLNVLSQGAHVQSRASNLIPSDLSYNQFRGAAYRAIAKTSLNGWHGLRHRYAQRRYRALTKVACPVSIGIKHGVMHHRYIANTNGCPLQEAKLLDRQARERIAEELGHRRAEITNSYLG